MPRSTPRRVNAFMLTDAPAENFVRPGVDPEALVAQYGRGVPVGMLVALREGPVSQILPCHGPS